MLLFYFSLITYIVSQRNVRINNNLSILNRRITSTSISQTSTVRTTYNTTRTITSNSPYIYTIPFMKELLSLELPDPDAIPSSRMPFRPTNRQLDTEQDNGTNDAMLSAFKASQNSQIAISAAAKAVVTCTAYGSIDCEELMKTKNQTDVYLKIASNSLQQAKASANTVTYSSSFSIVGPLDRTNSRMRDWATQVAQIAVNQAQIAAQVTATASAQCEIIVDIKCNKCKNG